MCGCLKRGQAIVRAATSVVRGDLKRAGTSAAYVGKSLARDLGNGSLRAAAAARLAQMRKPR
jgi:hypothetical protein